MFRSAVDHTPVVGSGGAEATPPGSQRMWRVGRDVQSGHCMQPMFGCLFHGRTQALLDQLKVLETSGLGESMYGESQPLLLRFVQVMPCGQWSWDLRFCTQVC